MNRNKLVLFAAPALAALLMAGPALAQGLGQGPGQSMGQSMGQGHPQRIDRQGHHGPPDAVEQLARMQQTLDLSDEQSLQMLEVLQTAEADREALHTRVMESFQPEFCALRDRKEADILAILTPEQAATFEQLKQERAGRRGPPVLDCPDEDG
jgi:Spy/CpxP family protein refolding chaperone